MSSEASSVKGSSHLRIAAGYIKSLDSVHLVTAGYILLHLRVQIDNLVTEMAVSIASAAQSCTLRSPQNQRLRFPEVRLMARMGWIQKTSWPLHPSTSAPCKPAPCMLIPYIIDILESQLFPDQTTYFPTVPGESSATQSIGDGGKWIAIHSISATL